MRPSGLTDPDRRTKNLAAALGFLQLPARAPALQLLHRWLDSWSGIGLIVAGMPRQGFQVSLGEHGAGQWIADFYHGGGGHEPVAAAGTAQAATPWGAVQDVAWAAVKRDALKRTAQLGDPAS
jgi:hypothetical protein